MESLRSPAAEFDTLGYCAHDVCGARPLDADRNAGVDFACQMVSDIRESGAFDGVHLIPVSRYREIAARLERAW